MLTDATPPEKATFKSHKEITGTYGVKAAGLSFIPPAWRLDFAALSIASNRLWKEGKSIATSEEVAALEKWLNERSYERLILRSSGTDETISDRGKFTSVVVQAGWNIALVVERMEELYRLAHGVEPDAELGVVVQEYLAVDFAGHLSNEYRVSPTINQWSYELERPEWAPSKGLNSKFKTAPDPSASLRCGNQIPHQPLRSVAHFLVDQFKERCHLEWLVHQSTLYLAQIDFEWPSLDQGLDPKKDIHTEAPAELNLDAAKLFTAYQVGEKTKWPKLQNLSDFDFENMGLAPRIYPLSPKVLVNARNDRKAWSDLREEVASLTGNRLVVRTDCIQKGIKKFNLPRTDTKDAESALAWCVETMKDFAKREIREQNFMFLFHAFLPAKSAAWAYAKPGNPVVIVDALWGLPDGLQVLPVDTYEVNISQEKVVDTRTTFKPKFLTELDDGTWDYRNVKTKCGRHQVLSKSDKLEIATRTASIANKLGEDAQIMWFCEIPDEYQVGRNLPWFRSREVLDPSPRQEVHFRPFDVITPADLQRLPNEKVTLRLSPEANLIRDEAFLDSIVKVAKERGLPVQVEGSILGHAFYKLDQEGIPVVLSNAPKYYRKRNRQVFGKLVRDKIPAAIAAGGETVREAKLAKADLPVGLAGKLLEEMEEFLRATDAEEQAAEIADMLEVVKGLAAATNHSWTSIERIAKAKTEKRGGFRDGRVLIETALPHRDSPLERQEQVRAADLGGVESSKTLVEIPSSALVATATGPGVIFTYEDDSARFRVSIKDGAVQIARLDSAVPDVDAKQGSLFPDD